MKTGITSFRTAVAQMSSFGLAPAPSIIWAAGVQLNCDSLEKEDGARRLRCSRAWIGSR